MNPLCRIQNLFRRKPGIVGLPTLARHIPTDPALHAIDPRNERIVDLVRMVAERAAG
jgi:hypothetical protein